MSVRPRTESLISACLIVPVIRSRRPFFKSKPWKYLVLATLVIVVVTLFLPISRLRVCLNFSLYRFHYLLMPCAILLNYIIAAELLTKAFYARAKL